jgi:hypothetical protein
MQSMHIVLFALLGLVVAVGAPVVEQLIFEIRK